jgi:hypothetical protein
VLGVTAALLALVLAACSGSGSGSTSAAGTAAAGEPETPGSSAAAGGAVSFPLGKPDPCTLLTTDDLKQQLGFDYQEGVLDPVSTAGGEGGEFNESYCTWNPKDPKNLNTVTLVIHGPATDAKDSFAAAMTGTGVVVVSGIGDDAYIVHGSQAGSNFSVSFEKGPYVLDFNASGPDWVPTDAELTGVAKAAAARL